MKKKVLFINTRLIYPANGGRKVVLYNYCKGISEIYGHAIDILTFLDSGDEEYLNKQPEFVTIKSVLKPPTILEKGWNILGKSLIKRNWPVQVGLYYSRSNQKIIDKYIYDEKPDIIICDMARTAQYLINSIPNKSIKILDMDDLISERYKRQILSEDIGIDAIGAYITKVPKMIRSIINLGSIMRYILKLEYYLLAKYELYLKDYFDKYIFVSPVEVIKYNELCKFKKADYVTIGVDFDYYSEKFDIKQNKEIVFLGNMNISHNKKAVEFFIKEIYPLIKEHDSNISFKIVGKCDNNEYLREIEKNNGVYFTGEVEDIRPYIKSSKVSIAYLTYGSGIKTKILETMAMGIPVVTNSIGAEGIMLNKDSGLIVEDDVKVVASELIKLINDDDYNKEISINALRFIEENYRWETTLKRLENIF